MTSGYTSKLGLKVYPIDIKAQKINSSILKTFLIVLAYFKVEDKFGKAQFFQKSFSLANLSIKMVLEMFFLICSNTII